MILDVVLSYAARLGKPRASGDDPAIAGVNGEALM